MIILLMVYATVIVTAAATFYNYEAAPSDKE